MVSKKAMLLGAAIAAATALGAGPAGAAAGSMDEAQAMFQSYHKAIRAAEQCRRLNLDAEAWDKLADYIQEQIGRPVGPDQLALLEAAQQEARALILHRGCTYEKVADLLNAYDSGPGTALK